MPFIVVYKQTHCNACIFECVVLYAVHCLKMLVGCGTFDAIQQHSQIITFTQCRVCIIHATNGKAFLAHCPSLQLPIPHPLLRELIERKALCSFRFLVCFEPFLSIILEMADRVATSCTSSDCQTTPFVDWANGIANAQRQETAHAYQT